ncbi:MAG TPA: lysophospholipid acyltransferase family protein [bacterium]
MSFMYRFSRSVVRLHLNIWHGFKVEGLENILREGPLIVACNHISHIDPPALGVAFPRPVRFIAKVELFNSGVSNLYFNLINVIPVRRGGGGGEMLRRAAQCLRNGEVVGMFPEGTRSRTGMPGDAHTGFLVLAATSGAPVLPARVSGTYDCMPPGAKWISPGKIQLSFGELITYEKGELDPHNREQLKVEAQRILDQIHKLPGWFPKKLGLYPETP